MSASSKKKLRKEIAAEMLTEKQRQEKKEAKKLKAMTISFVAIMLVIAIVFSVVLIDKGVEQSGYFYKKTTAAVINNQNISSVQMNYYLTDYIKNTYYGIQEHKGELDEKIAAHARGWKTERLTRVSRSILRLAVYEMLYCKEIPASVSLNEAIELAKKFEDEKARPFINGVLNSIKTETEQA